MLNDSVGWRVDEMGLYGLFVSHLGSGIPTIWPGNQVEETSDGGSSWNSVLSQSTGIWSIDFLTQRVGFVVGTSNLEETTDGGATWATLSVPSSLLANVSFGSPDDGVGVSVDGPLVTTADGGQSWQRNDPSWHKKAKMMQCKYCIILAQCVVLVLLQPQYGR